MAAPQSIKMKRERPRHKQSAAFRSRSRRKSNAVHRVRSRSHQGGLQADYITSYKTCMMSMHESKDVRSIASPHKTWFGGC